MFTILLTEPQLQSDSYARGFLECKASPPVAFFKTTTTRVRFFTLNPPSWIVHP